MDKSASKGKIYSIISAVIIFAIYILQKALSIALEPTKQLLITEAIIFTAFVGVVYALVRNSHQPFYGILASLFGVRMMPPAISALKSFSPEADILYFLVTKAAVVLFLFAIVKLYEQQAKPRLIKPIPILCLIIVVPFVNEIQATLSDFIVDETGSMLYAYFSNFILYTLAMLVLLYIATKTSKVSAQLICDFQLVALLLNAGRKTASVVLNLFVLHNHVSRSYYCWIAIYAFFFIAFYILKNKRKVDVNIPISE